SLRRSGLGRLGCGRPGTSLTLCRRTHARATRDASWIRSRLPPELKTCLCRRSHRRLGAAVSSRLPTTTSPPRSPAPSRHAPSSELPHGHRPARAGVSSGRGACARRGPAPPGAFPSAALATCPAPCRVTLITLRMAIRGPDVVHASRNLVYGSAPIAHYLLAGSHSEKGCRDGSRQSRQHSGLHLLHR